jgi:hypothetical protein
MYTIYYPPDTIAQNNTQVKITIIANIAPTPVHQYINKKASHLRLTIKQAQK